MGRRHRRQRQPHHDRRPLPQDLAEIASTYACKSSLLAFEPINEPPATTAEHGAEINKLDQIFLDTISSSGGFNA